VVEKITRYRLEPQTGMSFRLEKGQILR